LDTQTVITELPHVVNDSPAFMGIEEKTPEYLELRAKIIEAARILREGPEC
jgi:hypothetical protein